MIIYPVSSFGFIVILKNNTQSTQTNLLPCPKISKYDFIRTVKKIINEIKFRYDFSFYNIKTKINCSNYCDLQIFVMKCTPFPENLVTVRKKFFIKKSYDTVLSYREKTLIKFESLDNLIDCIHTLHHFILRKQKNFDSITSGIYIKNNTFLLLIIKPLNTLSDLSKISSEYGKIIRYSQKLKYEFSKLNIENPLKDLGKW